MVAAAALCGLPRLAVHQDSSSRVRNSGRRTPRRRRAPRSRSWRVASGPLSAIAVGVYRESSRSSIGVLVEHHLVGPASTAAALRPRAAASSSDSRAARPCSAPTAPLLDHRAGDPSTPTVVAAASALRRHGAPKAASRPRRAPRAARELGGPPRRTHARSPELVLDAGEQRRRGPLKCGWSAERQPEPPALLPRSRRT